MKSQEERQVGFIKGVAHAATMINKYGVDAYALICQSGITTAE
ncbi:hypothetical protein [Halalkalibacter oceani]|nr:hypothetical protein [Halalkalibacter oceani]